ncbi:hypothetical protein BDV25DRAFT_171467 [Aspergillus avenaceus]|uniref:VWFA domain-containing protein n=1 Tax=Aspergillus avenaceus TaxID=36643 RepID=A0A5N6TYM9_ASPAV|nr:hypothetical protein BDV25DRAFT_171467 [Aspergillus avenaceus]
MSPNSDEEEEFLDKLVKDIVDQFFTEFRLQLRDLAPDDDSPTPMQSEFIPETEKDYQEYIWRYIKRNLPRFYERGDPFVENLVTRAAACSRQITQEYDLDRKVTPKVAIMGLYDFVILCDDSGSMKKGTRIQALADVCQRISHIASAIHPQGVFLRFLNNQSDYPCEMMSDSEAIRAKILSTRYGGFTQLGTMLQTNITEPFIFEKYERKELKKPIIAVVITDGCPTKERREMFQEAVLYCKGRLTELKYEPASVIFLISRIGDDPEAEFFLSGLRTKALEEMLYSCPDQLDKRRHVFRRAEKNSEYSSRLINMFATALDGQAEMPTLRPGDRSV